MAFHIRVVSAKACVYVTNNVINVFLGKYFSFCARNYFEITSHTNVGPELLTQVQIKMGNSQSLEITTEQKEHRGKKNKIVESNGHTLSALDVADAVTCKTSVQQNSEPPSTALTVTATPSPAPTLSNGKQTSAPVVSPDVSAEQEVPAENSTEAKQEPPKAAESARFFSKMFKKKAEPVAPATETDSTAEEQITQDTESECQMSEPPSIKASSLPQKEPQGESLNPSAAEVAVNAQPEETSAEENPVMNFFKTLVSPTKSTKDATPDASKNQSQKETPSAPPPSVQEAPKAPPPPPPAPPKMEVKAELAVKKEEAPAAAAAAAPASKEPETSGKAKPKDSPFSKLFRPKALLGKVVSKVQAVAAGSGAGASAKTSAPSVVKEEAQRVEVDASKTRTLEVAAKPELPPAPKAEEKKTEKKPSPFANLLKPKVLLGQVSSKIQAAASSAAVSLSHSAGGGAAAEPKKEAPAAPAAPAAEAAPSAKAKEEPKTAAAAAPAAAPDNKSVGSADNPSPSGTRKLEKRNSIQLFFKNLGQKRHSDAGVQTEPVAPEKAK